MQSKLKYKMDVSYETKYNSVMEPPFDSFSPAQKPVDLRFRVQADDYKAPSYK